MADALLDLLTPHLPSSTPSTSFTSASTTTYLTRLSTLTTTSLTTTEPDTLTHDLHTTLSSLHALTRRSTTSIDTAITSLESLRHTLPTLATLTADLNAAIPQLDTAAAAFAQKYARGTENPLLEKRKRVIRLSDNVERVSDMLELPSLLTSTIAASAGSTNSSTSTASTTSTTPSSTITSANAHYASALDIHAHIRRLSRLYPDSALVHSISLQADDAMRGLTTNLITALRSPSLKLAGGMRLIGLLRRVAPELDEVTAVPVSISGNTALTNSMGKPFATGTTGASSSTTGEGSLGALFLISRLSNLHSTLEALEPLRELADQETSQRVAQTTTTKLNGNKSSRAATTSTDRNAWSAGQQTERYLKRYIEIFREQCFSIISMYKSIFPASLPGPSAVTNTYETPASSISTTEIHENQPESLTLPPALSTFTLHTVSSLLLNTLRTYLPNVRDQSSRDSLLTQVLYCAASLGRLGGDYGLLIAELAETDGHDEEDDEIEYDEELDMDEEDNDEETEDKAADGGTGTGTKNGILPDPEWVMVMKRHRVAASRLELLASGVGTSNVSASASTIGTGSLGSSTAIGRFGSISVSGVGTAT